jgi:RHS repeat-associated protein
MTSTLAPVPAGLWNHDANDRFTAGDTYDNNGNTASSGGIANVYDFENHLIQKGGVTIAYDRDGNRVSKTVAGVTTTYLVDSLNPTGYAQVVYESFNSSSSGNREQGHSYVYSLEVISQTRSNTQKIYYAHDGNGSVRALTDPAGAVTDTDDYDALGNIVHSTGSTPNNYLFAGEQFDPDLGLYYNRARYLNVSTGRFWSRDTDEGFDGTPLSLHKYLYTSADPVNFKDPSGLDDISPADLPAVFSVCTRSRATTSMSRNLVRSALLPSGPCPGTILVLLSAKGRTLPAATIIPSIFPPARKAVKKSIAHVNHVGLLEVNVDVRVGMRRLEILQHHDFTVGLRFLAAAAKHPQAMPEGADPKAHCRAALPCASWCFRGPALWRPRRADWRYCPCGRNASACRSPSSAAHCPAHRAFLSTSARPA